MSLTKRIIFNLKTATVVVIFIWYHALYARIPDATDTTKVNADTIGASKTSDTAHIIKRNSLHAGWYFGTNFNLPGYTSISSLALGGYIAYMRDFNVFGIRYIVSGGGNGKFVQDAGLLYGIGYFDGSFFISASTGLEYVHTSYPGNIMQSVSNKDTTYNIVNTNVIGIPYQLQIVYSFIGVTLFGDINKSFTHAGILLTFQGGMFF